MVKHYKTINDATRLWVGEFNAISTDIIDLMMSCGSSGWEEVTTIRVGVNVFVYNHPKNYNGTSHYGNIVGEPSDECDLWEIELDDGVVIRLPSDGFEREDIGSLPMWGAMWSFGDPLDTYWLEEEDGIEIMSRCGFRIYRFDEYGYFFGIDGCGYDFYEAHWEPLYKARGLHWHEEE